MLPLLRIIYGVDASFSSWSKSICISKTGVRRIIEPKDLLPPFKGEVLPDSLNTELLL